MRNFLRYLAVIGIFAFFGVISNVDNTYAAEYIKSAYVSWQWTECNGVYYNGGGCSNWGESYFKVSFTYGKDCGNNCVIESSYFKCCGTAYQSEWSGLAAGIQVTTKGVESGGYEYYNVKLSANGSYYQPVCGQIKKKKDLKKGRLVITGKNIYDDYNIMSGSNNLGHQEIEGVGWVYAHYKNLWNNRSDKYKFIGWKLKGANGNRPGLENLIVDTNSSHSPYVASPTSGYDNWSKRVYQRLYYKLGEGEAKDIYAYYAPACTITIDRGEGTTVNVNRKNSVYSGKGTLPSGFDIYLDDNIDVTFGLEEGYKWVSRSINGSDKDTEYNNYVVGHQIGNNRRTCEDVKIVARAERADDDGDIETINTGVFMEIKKNDEAGFNKKDRYVKPGDTVYYRAQYSPSTQSVTEEKPDSIRINNDEIVTNESNLSTKDLFNNSGNGEWSNYFDIMSSSSMFALNFMNDASERCDGSRHSYRCNYDVGDSNNKEVVNSYTVQKDDVGEELKEEAVINLNIDIVGNLESAGEQAVAENESVEVSQEVEGENIDVNTEIYNIGGVSGEITTSEKDRAVNPSSIRKKIKDNNVSYDIFTDLISDDVQAVVPYNFENEIDMNDNGDDTAFAGETTKIDFGIVTKPKVNGLVGGDAYATVVRNAMWKVKVCYGVGFANCYESDTKTGNLHEYDNIEGESIKKDDGTSVSINMPDLSAGTKVKVIALTYPKNSGPDNNLAADYYDPNNVNSWVSAEKIITIAKKPSFQVWGGDIYLGDKAEVPLANKKKLNGYDDEALNGGRLFGSWGELAVVANDPGKLASGAVLGYTSNNSGELKAEPGGGTKNELEGKLGELTFGSGGGDLNIEKLVETLEKRVTNKETTDTVMKPGQSENIETITIGKGESILYKNEDKNGTLTIKSNIEYNNDNYDTLESIPKVIIYANNINIDCGVERIDAILIAKNNIDTCPGDFEAAKSKAINSTPLQINGAVIAGETLNLNRTYGAATGDKSIVPAETINMDPSWYLWAADIIPEVTNGTDDKTNDILVPTYMRELPPRY